LSAELSLNDGKGDEWTRKRRQLQREMAREAFQHQLLDGIVAYVAILDEDGHILEVNGNALVLGGLDMNELIGTRFTEAYWFQGHPEAAEITENALKRARHGDPVEAEIVVGEMHGPIHVLARYAALDCEDGEECFLLASGVNITDRVRAARIAQDERNRLNIVMRQESMASWEENFAEGHRKWDDHLRDLFRRADCDLLVRENRWKEMLVEEDRSKPTVAFEKALRDNVTYKVEYRVRGDDGVIRCFRSEGVVERDAKGVPMRALGVVEDITSQRAAFDAMEESNRRFRLMADKLPLIVWMHDSEGEQEFVNETFARYFNVDRAAMKGDRWKDLPVPEEMRAYTEKFLQCVADRSSFNAVTRARDGKGRLRWLESWAEPHFSDDGEFLGHIGASADITERIEHEEKLRLLMGEVNHRSKNLLGVVQAMARRTLSGSQEGFLASFTDRLQALAASQDLIIASQWDAVTVSELIKAQLYHLGKDDFDRITMDGDPVTLTPDAAQGIGMALHELATNAQKYGALSAMTGTVQVDWRVITDQDGEDEFVMHWTESGGPRVDSPKERGFGTTVVEFMASRAVRGKAELDFREDGIVWSLRAPLNNVGARL
jgi:PAS domain S-box-containing protein